MGSARTLCIGSQEKHHNLFFKSDTFVPSCAHFSRIWKSHPKFHLQSTRKNLIEHNGKCWQHQLNPSSSIFHLMMRYVRKPPSDAKSYATVAPQNIRILGYHLIHTMATSCKTVHYISMQEVLKLHPSHVRCTV
jgi:hypothetical protein